LINDIALDTLRAMLLRFQLHALPGVLPQLPANSRCSCWQLVVVVLVQSDSDISGISLMVLRQRFLCFSVGGTGQPARPVMLLYLAATLIPAAQCSLFLVLSKSSVCCGAGYI
jgi:hypothetical protein